MGGFQEEVCSGVCVVDLGCRLCAPGQARCDGLDVEVCDTAGEAWLPGGTCDPVQGLACDEVLGKCVGACSRDVLGLNYIGCDYYASVLPQHDSFNTADKDVFGIGVANSTDQDATVTITHGEMEIAVAVVPAKSAEVFARPEYPLVAWIDETTKGFGPSKVVPDGVYRVR